MILSLKKEHPKISLLKQSNCKIFPTSLYNVHESLTWPKNESDIKKNKYMAHGRFGYPGDLLQK